MKLTNGYYWFRYFKETKDDKTKWRIGYYYSDVKVLSFDNCTIELKFVEVDPIEIKKEGQLYEY